jgi:hypothetical protein
MQLSEENIRFQLAHLYGALEAAIAHQHTSKKWCLTIWLAILAVLLTEKMKADFSDQIILTLLPVFTFWLYDGISAGQAIMWERRAMKLERLLFTENKDVLEPEILLYRVGHYHITFKEKIECFATAIFTMETVFVFYLALVGLSLIAIWVRYSNLTTP